MPDRGRVQQGERLVASLLALSIAGAVLLVVVYWRGGQPQLEGVGLGVALLALGGALVLWAHRLLPNDEASEPWGPLDDPADREAAAIEFDRDAVLERRPLLRRMFGAAVGALGVAAVFPIRSLGPKPGDALRVTSWRRGLRLVTADGRVVRADEVPVGALVTVFPEGHIDAADSVAVLVRASEGAINASAERKSWSPRGLIAYSKICTHAGCPVGLYLDDSQTLLCPCHQSEFDVLNEAVPLSGPAARRLPQLPLEIDAAGEITATGDFSDPVGPAWWSR